MPNAEATTIEQTAAVAEQGASTAPEQATSKKGASQKKNAPKASKGAKEAKPAASKKESKPASKKASKAAASKPAAKKEAKPASKKASKPAAAKDGQPREGSKKQIVLALLQRKGGATMAEIAKATGWQNHSIRGFISGTLTKKMDLPISSTKNEAGERTYRIEK